MYDLYLDDPKSIKCKAEISGAENSTKKVRLMLETSGHCMYFNGKVSDNGDIEVPMLSLKNIFKENTKGTLMLEMVVDDTLFIPWQTEFEAKLKKKVAISEIKSHEGGKKVSMVTTPTLRKTPEPTPIPKSTQSPKTIIEHVKSIAKTMKKEKISYKNLSENKMRFGQIIETYIKDNKLTADELKKIQGILINHITEL